MRHRLAGATLLLLVPSGATAVAQDSGAADTAESTSPSTGGLEVEQQSTPEATTTS